MYSDTPIEDAIGEIESSRVGRDDLAAVRGGGGRPAT